jgi:asparagine synthase (glutamine-hydrolysing)
MIGRDRNGWSETLDAAWEVAIARWRRRTEPFTLLFSGGVDSSLLAWELRDAPGIGLFTIGTTGSDDLIQGRRASDLLGLRWSGVEIGAPEIAQIGHRLGPELRAAGRSDRSVLISLALAMAKASARSVVCGQGIDELFGGYAHFNGLSSEAALRRSDADLEKLRCTDWPATERIARSFQKLVSAPYLDPEFLKAVGAIPPEERLRSPPRKAFFREWARARGLPEPLAVRPKRAFQFGSGIDRATRSPGVISRP